MNTKMLPSMEINMQLVTMIKMMNAEGFCFLKLLIAAPFSPTHTETTNTTDTTTMAMSVSRGFRILQGSSIEHMRASLNSFGILLNLMPW